MLLPPAGLRALDDFDVSGGRNACDVRPRKLRNSADLSQASEKRVRLILTAAVAAGEREDAHPARDVGHPLQ